MENSQREISEKLNADLFRLLRLSLGQEKDQASVRLSEEEFDALLKLAKHHEVQPLAAYGLLLAGDLTQQQEQRCRQLIYQAMLHQQRMEQELQRTCDLLEEAGIPHIPLKGAVIRKLYPEPWMRTSGDIDILVKDADAAAKLLVENGYRYGKLGSHDIAVISPKGVTIEMHFQLIESDSRINTLLEGVWERTLPQDNSCCYKMEPELFYFYHIAHMAKHMFYGGCGIRYFADIWLLNENLQMNAEKKQQLLRKGGLFAFAQQAEGLSHLWFGNGKMELLVLELERYILDGSIFGSKSNIVRLRRTKTDSTIGFLLQRLFPPYHLMILQYPALRKHPIMLPWYWGKRWLDRIFTEKKLLGATQELAMHRKLGEEDVADVKRLFEELELL